MTRIKLIYIIAMIGACVLPIHAQDTPAMSIAASADSTTLVQGDRTSVLVEVIKNGHKGDMLTMPQKEQDYFGLEMIDCLVDSADLGNDRIQLRYRFTFQAFDPMAVLTLPPFVYVVGNDTLRSDILTFKVLPVDLPPELGDPEQPDSLKINPDEGVAAIQSKWYDVIPDWTLWALIGLLLVAAAVVLYLLYRKNGPGIFVPRKPVPPYELAINRLNQLKNKQLIERGMGKDFYTEVTDIWRAYLQGRFGISAMEMTSGQIIKELRDNKETELTADQMARILEISDFVKFAALNPTPDEMLQAFNTIYSFVESTRPQPQADDAHKAKPVNKK